MCGAADNTTIHVLPMCKRNLRLELYLSSYYQNFQEIAPNFTYSQKTKKQNKTKQKNLYFVSIMKSESVVRPTASTF